MMVVPVHDEIVLQVPRADAPEIMKIVKECMTTTEGWAVPLTAGIDGPMENWGSKYCTYFGSMVELYQSKSFTARWDTGVIYRPPNRCWNFDTNYRSSPPPGTLDAASWTRGSWAKY